MSLQRSLWQSGRAAARRSPARWLRAVVLAIGAFTVTLTVIGVALGAARVDGTTRRGFADDPVEARPGQSAHLSVARLPFAAVGDAPVTVIGLADGDGSLLPPGVHRLPRPGEAVLSPSLRTDLGADASRFGTDVGTIDPDVLETPTERRVYVGLAAAPADSVRAVSFGPEAGLFNPGTGMLYQPSKPAILVSVALTLGLAGSSALAVGAGITPASRRNLARVMELSGATATSRVVATAASDLLPLLFGAVCAACAAAPLLATDVLVPTTRTVLAVEDSRAVAWAWPVGVVAAVLTGLTFGVLAGRRALVPRRGHGRRGLPTAAAGLGGLAVLVLLRPALAVVPSSGTLVVFIAVVLFAAWLLPRTAGWVAATAGRALAVASRRAGLAGSLVAGRQLAADPRRTATTVAPVMVGVLVLALVSLWGGVLNRQESAARESLAMSQGRLAQVVLAEPAPRRLVEYLRSPGAGIATVLVGPAATPDGVDRVHGTCPALTALGLRCTAGRQQYGSTPAGRALAAWSSPVVEVDPSVPAPPGAGDLVYLVGLDRAVDVGAVTRHVIAVAPAAASVELLGQGWTVAGSTSGTQARWLLLLGAVSITALVLAFGLAGAAKLGEQVAESAAVLRWSDRRAPLAAMAWWRGAAPYALAFLAADAVAEWFARILHDADARFILPQAFHPVVLTLGGLLTVLLGLAAYATMRQDTTVA